jgi:peptide/nickel transport system ATP-binding protein
MPSIRKNAEMLLDVRDWSVSFSTPGGRVDAVCGVDVTIERGECLAVVGESGSGKSQLFQSLFGLQASNGVTSDNVRWQGEELADPSSLLGREVSFVFQDPLTSLTPHMTIAAQMRETLMRRGSISRREADHKCLALLQRCHLQDAERRLTQYPHELSGGMRQRVMIAQAIATHPKLLIADEPTTALDVTLQAEIIDLLNELRAEYGLALVFITHDMRVAQRIADRIVVMHQGKIVETGPSDIILTVPQHDYTKKLLDAFFAKESVLPRSLMQEFGTPVVTARNVSVSYPDNTGWFRRERTTVVQDVSFTIAAGECLAVVGESGSGKSTLARAVAALIACDSGSIMIDGMPMAEIAPHLVQTVFQDPLASLDPRQRVGDAAREALDILYPHLARSDRLARVEQMFARVGLSIDFMSRFPHELSGGQCQRVGICRALLAQPKLLICDEAISALDATTAMQILDLLADIKARDQMAILFITHDLAAAQRLAEKVIVLENGQIIESGQSVDIFAEPKHATTKALLQASGIAA